jgi:NhaP-type Na+/H+ or K+/H+ antiporter
VPIAVAIQAAASPVPWGSAMPPLALGVVLLGLLLQGLSLVPMARRLGLASRP